MKLSFDISKHAVVQAKERQFTRRDIEKALKEGEEFEGYPTKHDVPTKVYVAPINGRFISVVCTKRKRRMYVVTVYESSDWQVKAFKDKRGEKHG